MNFGRNPLFREFERKARAEFQKSSVGQLMREVQRGASTPSGVRRVGRLLERASRESKRLPCLNRLGGQQFGAFAADLEKYSRGGGYAKQLVAGFLGQMGPAGKLIGALIGGSVQGKKGLEREIGTAFEFLRIFKPELLSAEAKQGKIISTARGQLDDPEYLAKLLEAQGYEVIRPDVKPAGRQRRTVDVDLEEGRTKRFPKNHPIVTGEMVPSPQSSNVHSFGYDNNSSYLYVRFKAPKAPGAKGPRPQSPGSLYRYAAVMPEKFLRMYQAHSKGTWIWDNIRQRGTVSGHTHDYELVGIMDQYVPRKAVYRGRTLGEWYMPRTVRGEGGRRLTSRLGAEPLTGAPNTGAPPALNTGAP